MTQPTTFNPNVPLANWSYSQWQPAFLTNFEQLYAAFKANHEPLDAVSNAGNHTNVQLYDQPISPTVSNTELALFSQMVPSQVDQIFMKYQDNKTQFQWTNYQIFVVSPIGNSQTTQFTMLPGGIICYFGTWTGTGDQGGTNSGFLKPLLYLNSPNIAKNLLSVNFTQITPFIPSQVSATPSVTPQIENGLVNSIQLSVSNFLTVSGNISYYYMILANT